MSDQDGIQQGETRPAGEGLTDDELVEQVAGQTASDLKNADVFEREADGAATDTEAAKASADELAGEGDSE
jgi:protease I